MFVSSMITTIASIIGMSVWLYWSRLNKDRWRYAVAPLSYFAHILLFYLCVLRYYMSGAMTPKFLNIWSNGIRLHGIILLIGIGLLFICKIRGGCPKWMQPK